MSRDQAEWMFLVILADVGILLWQGSDIVAAWVNYLWDSGTALRLTCRLHLELIHTFTDWCS